MRRPPGQPTLALDEEPPAIPPHRDIPGGICARCGRPTREGISCGWHKAAAPSRKQGGTARVAGRAEGLAADQINKTVALLMCQGKQFSCMARAPDCEVRGDPVKDNGQGGPGGLGVSG